MAALRQTIGLPFKRSFHHSNISAMSFEIKSHIKDGHFQRQVSEFRDAISKEPGAKFAPEKGRYHLYVSYACPWAHRTLIVRELKGLQDFISVNVVHWLLKSEGWKFEPSVPGATEDEVNGAKHIMDLYKKANPDYSARATVPLLWDKKLGTAVSNESADILRFLGSEFNDVVDPKYKDLDLYPKDLRDKIDEANQWIYDGLNNGVYKSGFATTQEAYDQNVVKVFESLDRVEKLLKDNGGPYLFGDRLTETDIRLFTTIIRFDPVYHQHFKCNFTTIRDGYPHIHKWLRNLYWNHEAFRNTTDFDHIKYHYTKSHTNINPYGITPAGPVPNIRPLDD